MWKGKTINGDELIHSYDTMSVVEDELRLLEFWIHFI